MINKTKKAWWSKKYEKNSYTFNQNYNKVYLKYVNGYHQLDLSTNNPLTPDQICNSPFCQPYISYHVSSENLVMNQLIIPKLIFFLILITYLVDIVLIL